MRLSLFKLHREVSDPKSIVISRKAGRWYVSFNFEDANLPAPLPREEILEKLAHIDEHQLQKLIWAGDRGVRDILHGSDGKVFNFDASAIVKNQRRELAKRRLQRRLARQQKGSRRRDKTKRRMAQISHQQAEVRRDFAHQTSRKLVNSDFKVFVFEDLKIANMTKRPKKKQDESSGQYLPNGAAAKAGLNRNILQSCWGNIVSFTHYKAERSEKCASRYTHISALRRAPNADTRHPKIAPQSSFRVPLVAFRLTPISTPVPCFAPEAQSTSRQVIGAKTPKEVSKFQKKGLGIRPSKLRGGLRLCCIL